MCVSCLHVQPLRCTINFELYQFMSCRSMHSCCHGVPFESKIIVAPQPSLLLLCGSLQVAACRLQPAHLASFDGQNLTRFGCVCQCSEVKDERWPIIVGGHITCF